MPLERESDDFRPGTNEELKRIRRVVERIEQDLYSTDTESPGVALRLDRIERGIGRFLSIMSWVGGGSLAGLAAALLLLWRLLQAMDKIPA